MATNPKLYSSKAGLPPGSLVYVGPEKTSSVKIIEVNFSPDHYNEKKLSDIKASNALKVTNELSTWISMDGVHDIDKIEAVGSFLNLDHLVLEDIVNTSSRPKFEDLGDYLFLSMSMLRINENDFSLIKEQLNLVLSDKWLLSVDDSDQDVFAQYRERIRLAKGMSRQRKEDFVFYRLIDIVVDNYFHLTEKLADDLDALEDKILENTNESLAQEIYSFKKKIGVIRKAIVPLREAVFSIIKTDNSLISENTLKYFRDVHDHIIQLIESVESQKDTVNDFLNLYMSGMSNKMNEVMKVLTIFAAIFIPLTFIAGIYGMNFEYIPELRWKYGYFATWGIMLLVVLGLLFYFKRKKWL